MIIHMDGDLLKVQKDMNIDVICHQVNCQGKMASGIAKQMRETLPAGSTIGFPYLIGCDRGGANWNVIEAMIKEVFNNEYVVYIVHYNGGK